MSSSVGLGILLITDYIQSSVYWWLVNSKGWPRECIHSPPLSKELVNYQCLLLCHSLENPIHLCLGVLQNLSKAPHVAENNPVRAWGKNSKLVEVCPILHQCCGPANEKKGIFKDTGENADWPPVKGFTNHNCTWSMSSLLFLIPLEQVVWEIMAPWSFSASDTKGKRTYILIKLKWRNPNKKPVSRSKVLLQPFDAQLVFWRFFCS